jgi:hypothetical protein
VVVKSVVEREMANLPPAPPGPPGRDADPEATEKLVDQYVQRAVSAIELPRVPTEDDFDAMVEKAVRTAIERLPVARDGKDGVGLAGGMINRSGELILTLTDGTILPLGRVVGEDADNSLMLRAINEAVAQIPRPKDGKDGRGFDNVWAEQTGDRTFAIKFQAGDEIKEFPLTLSTMIYRSIWKAGETYEVGDTTTFGGSLWHANEKTTDQPETSAAWQLVAKRGMNGRSAFDVARGRGFKGTEQEWLLSLKGKDGPPGPPGRDMTHVLPDGTKY